MVFTKKEIFPGSQTGLSLKAENGIIKIDRSGQSHTGREHTSFLKGCEQRAVLVFPRIQKGMQAMNERFFELKKDRQDRIINGAMRIFAQNGYRHASTDEMVASASISKGLLFHYFKSKKGTWEFLYEYSTRYTLLELREAGRHQGCDFFEMYRQLVKADAAVLRKYPYMPLFLRRADSELGMNDPKFKPEIPESLAHAVADRRLSLVIEADRPPFLSRQDACKISQMLEYTRFGLMQELLAIEEASSGRKSAKGKDAAAAPGNAAAKPAAVDALAAAGEMSSRSFPEDIPKKAEQIRRDESLPFHAQYAERLNEYLQTLRKMNI